jgi:tripartite-type tricarboxylate transporter receptor subunit TctC
MAASVLGLASMPSQAGRYPERIIRIGVPFPPGGPTDVAARLIGQSLSSRLGQTVARL